MLQAGRKLAAEPAVWSGTSYDAHGRIQGALDDPEQLVAVLDDLAIDGPLREGIITSDGDLGVVDGLLLQRAELAATAAALGVACAELSNYQPGALT